MLEKEFFFVLLHASAHLPICPGSGSGFVSFLTDPDPTFIMQIRIRITVFLHCSGKCYRAGAAFLRAGAAAEKTTGSSSIDPTICFVNLL